MGKDREISGVEVMIVVGILIPIYMGLAPRDIRQEVFDYTCKFVGTIFFIGVAYTLYLILLKDKITQRRERKMQQEALKTQRELRERTERYKQELKQMEQEQQMLAKIIKNARQETNPSCSCPDTECD